MDDGNSSLSLLGDLLLKIELSIGINISGMWVVESLSVNKAQESSDCESKFHSFY